MALTELDRILHKLVTGEIDSIEIATLNAGKAFKLTIDSDQVLVSAEERTIEQAARQALKMHHVAMADQYED